ncbi:MAG: hypothetical protein ACLROW_17020 [Roseburia faecis]
MKETIDLLGKIITNILTALYEPFGFSLLLSFLAPQKAKITQNSEWQEKSQEFLNMRDKGDRYGKFIIHISYGGASSLLYL